MGEIIAIMGPTGSGKSVQADILANHHGWRHLSIGALLRERMSDDPQLHAGALVDSGKVESLLIEVVASVPSSQPIVFDGFPRLLDEAQWMSGQLTSWGRRLARVVLLEISEEETSKRLMLRGRNDDTEQAQAKKWRDYESLTMPVIEYYEKQGLLARVDGVGSVQDIAKRVEGVIGK